MSKINVQSHFFKGMVIFFPENWLNEHIIKLYFSLNVLVEMIRQKFWFNFY